MRNVDRLERALTYCALAILLLTAAMRAQDQSNIGARKDYVEIAAALQSLIHQEMQDKQLLAFSIALVDGNEIVWAQGFGYQDPEHKITATAHTRNSEASAPKIHNDLTTTDIEASTQIHLAVQLSYTTRVSH